MLKDLPWCAKTFLKILAGAIDGLDCHTVEFYYIMKILEDSDSICKNQTDDGEALVWVPIDEISNSDIKPVFIKSHINNILNTDSTIHIIWDKDR